MYETHGNKSLRFRKNKKNWDMASRLKNSMVDILSFVLFHTIQVLKKKAGKLEISTYEVNGFQ